MNNSNTIMEKSKIDKNEKVGTDGLTKKERRALKVNARQPQDNRIATAQNEGFIDKNKVDKLCDTLTEIESVQTVESSKPLSEKELRKLEWTKKLEEKKKEKLSENNLSRAELKVLRREQQEAQRQLKAAPKNFPNEKKIVENQVGDKKQVKNEPIASKKSEVKSPKKEIKKSIQFHKVQLVQHLYNEEILKLEANTVIVHQNIHPAFIRLGVQYGNKIVLGSNARCLALLSALKSLVNDLKSPPKQEFCRYLETVLQVSANYLYTCRPFAVSMTNALRYFKLQLTQIDTNLKDSEKKVKLQDIIDTYINDDIRKAGDAISMKVREKISNGDVILTYGCSSLLKKILLEAHNDGKKFEVIIVDGRPLLEGKELLRRLVVAGIKCTYVFINALSYVMNSVTKVVLGAHALLTNGYVMSRIGTAQVALVAREYNKPVLVCCETYKFSERVQTDSFVYNELGNPDALSTTHVNIPSALSKWKDMSKLTPLSLLYDVTPPDLVTAVVTEIAILPCTSVPVVLRINASETT